MWPSYWVLLSLRSRGPCTPRWVEVPKSPGAASADLVSLEDLPESQDQVMNISVMLPALIIALMAVIPQPAENTFLLYKAWIWHPYHSESAPGIMGQVLLSTERWRPQEALLRTEEAKNEKAQDLLRECPNLGIPALWMETTTMDTMETSLLVVLLAVEPLPEGAGVAVTGLEGAA